MREPDSDRIFTCDWSCLFVTGLTVLLCVFMVVLGIMIGMEMIKKQIDEDMRQRNKYPGWPGGNYTGEDGPPPRLDLVSSSEAEYVPGPGNTQDYDDANRNDKEYMDQLLKEFPWMSRSCGLKNRQVVRKGSDKGFDKGSDRPKSNSSDYPDDYPGDDNDPIDPILGRRRRVLYTASIQAKAGEYPWYLYFTTYSERTYGDAILRSYTECGASLVAAQYGITAAHCVKGDKMYVTGGYLWLKQVMGNEGSLVKEVNRKVTHFWIHPEYDNSTFPSPDIAVLRWEKPIQRLHTRNGTVVLNPICLPSLRVARKYGLNLYGYHFLAGFGHTGNAPSGEQQTDRLRVSAPLYYRPRYTYPSDSLCSLNIGHFLMFCREAGAPDEPTPCEGDSGSPLVSNILDPTDPQNRYFQTGIVSSAHYLESKQEESQKANHTNPACQWTESSIFVSLIYFSDWVNSTIMAAADDLNDDFIDNY